MHNKCTSLFHKLETSVFFSGLETLLDKFILLLVVISGSFRGVSEMTILRLVFNIS